MTGISRARWVRVVLGSAAVFLAVPAWGAPSSPVPPPISVTADVMNIDAVSRVVTAEGRVRITDGMITATAERATLYQQQGRGVLSGEARAAGPSGVLKGAEMTITYVTRAITRLAARGRASLAAKDLTITAGMVTMSLVDDTVTADEAVVVMSPPDVIASGAHLTYRRARGAAALEGSARLQNRDGVITGERIESTGRWARAAVTGPVWGKFRDIEVRSRAAEYVSAEQKATFTGDVQVSQPGRVLFTEKVTVWYSTGRIVAEGQTRVRLEAPP